MNDCIVVLNCGSSSIKFAMFDATLHPLPRVPMWSGKVEGIGTDHPTATEAGAPTQALALDSAQPYHAALMHIRQRVEHRLDGRRLMAVAHRVVHGGSKYFAPVRVNADVLSDLRSYIPLAPLHQPFALEAIEALLSDLPDVPQVACFDTAFHRTLPQVETMLPLPYTAWERGLRRYGFHGLSYEYMSIALQERHGDIALGRTIVAHLGSGASLCAMHGLKSVATTMGFSALDGLMMGTRCGALDPGAVLYMMETEHLSPTQVGHVLYHESGLLGVSGLSSDPRDIIAHEADNPRAQAALALYVRRIVREIGALVAVLGGLDFLVFTAGIGEHNAVLRERIVGGLGYLGANLDDEANQAHAAVISTSASRIRVAVEPTNEEWVAARHAVKLCS
ncbi:acetate/propionate family kinase [Ralstonia mojiangensis]|uniref:acetate/propionate family kinase n=1 Tax=Ralstonia mojiangensis TaxID=2953895 RepID=UPI0020918E2E|nr:acetate/propionate family kinase [Ralstonia mojiangensis]MCO5415215.1 acetate/propionate family kinase [Ralstonia mojiangensis]